MSHSNLTFKLSATATALALGLGAGAGAHAFDIYNYWPDGDNIVMDDVLIPGGTWSTPAQSQMTEFNGVDTTNNSHAFRIANSPQFSFGSSDGDNTIGFLGESGLNSEYGLSYSNALAWTVCYSSWWTGRLNECDVMLDPSRAWRLSDDDANWFQSTVLHELGHVRGLDHFNGFLSMQNSGQSKFLRDETLYMDDRRAIRQNASTVSERDITMYNKWHTGAVPRWMTMSPTTLREGDTIDFNNITVENRGSRSFGSSVRFGIYLSSNTTISTGDQRLNTGSFGSFGTNSFSTFDWSATIPDVTDCVTRYVGGIIDDDGNWGERFEGNNATVFTDGEPYSGNTFTPTPLTIRLRQDAYEPNNSRTAATYVGSSFQRDDLSIDQDYENDYYRVSVGNFRRLVARVNFSHSRGDLGLRLYNSSGSLVASSNGSGNVEEISRNLSPGTYYVRVYGSGVGSCNRYDVNISTPSTLVWGGRQVLVTKATVLVPR